MTESPKMEGFIYLDGKAAYWGDRGEVLFRLPDGTMIPLDVVVAHNRGVRAEENRNRPPERSYTIAYVAVDRRKATKIEPNLVIKSDHKPILGETFRFVDTTRHGTDSTTIEMNYFEKIPKT